MLQEMLNFYNEDWTTDSGYLTDYGCHCRKDLDRLLPGHGLPIDAIDSGT